MTYLWGCRCWGLSIIKVTQRYHLCKLKEEPQIRAPMHCPSITQRFPRPPGLILGWGSGASPDQLTIIEPLLQPGLGQTQEARVSND